MENDTVLAAADVTRIRPETKAKSRRQSRGVDRRSAEDVGEGDGLQVAALDDVEQLAVGVGDGRQVGVTEDDGLWRERLGRGGDEVGFVDGPAVADGAAPQGDGGIAQIGGHVVGLAVMPPVGGRKYGVPSTP